MPNERSEWARVNGTEVKISYLPGVGTEDNPALSKKLFPRDEMAVMAELWRKHNVRVAFTTGTFDMIHVGHMRYLELAKSLGDILVVGLNSDSSVKGYKGPNRPILGEILRAEALYALACVNYICIYDELDGANLIRAIKPDAYLCVEGSWEGDLGAKAEVVAMAEHGGDIYYTPRQHPSISTSNILDRIAQTAVEEFRTNLDVGK